MKKWLGQMRGKIDILIAGTEIFEFFLNGRIYTKYIWFSLHPGFNPDFLPNELNLGDSLNLNLSPFKNEINVN